MTLQLWSRIVLRIRQNHHQHSRPIPTIQPIDEEKADAYQYRPLEKNCVRVLELSSSSNTGSILICRLIEVPISSNVAFEAVSYAWGGQLPSKSVFCNGQKLLITANVDAILRWFRPTREGAKRNLWIDAICINQDDAGERDQQVCMMGEVYSHAQRVLVWLRGRYMAEAIVEDVAAFRKLSLILRSTSKPKESQLDIGRWLFENGEGIDSDALDNFFRYLPWLARLWTVQEVAVSKRSTLVFDDIEVDFRQLVEALEAVNEYSLSEGLERPGWVTAARGWLYAHLNTFSRTSGSGSQSSFLDAANLMESFRWKHTSDPKDKVYAARSLLTGFCGLGLPRPDYSDLKSVASVYQETATALIRQAGQIGILTQVHGFNMTQNLPSWVPDWAYTMHPTYPPESLALRNVTNTASFTIDGAHLTLKGLIRENVSCRSGTSFAEPRGSFTVVRMDNGANVANMPLNETPDGDFRMLLGQDPWHDIDLWQLWNIRVLRDFVHFASQGHDSLDSHKQNALFDCLWNRFDIVPKLFDPTLQERWLAALRRDSQAKIDMAVCHKLSMACLKSDPVTAVPSYIANREEFRVRERMNNDADLDKFHRDTLRDNELKTLFRTTSGKLGIAPYTIQAGDEIILIPGVGTAMVVRQDGEYHRVIAPAYVHGIMEGVVWPPNEEHLQEFTFI